MTKFILLAVTAATLAAPALAGDPAAGETQFKKCKACHSIVAPDGTEIQKGGRTGPNLYGVIGRAVASDPDFSYGESLAALGATGAVWDEASLAAYVANPADYLKTTLGDDAAKSKMSFKLADGGADIAASRLHIVIRADADGFDIQLRPDHMLHRRDEFGRQPPMRHQHQSDHASSFFRLRAASKSAASSACPLPSMSRWWAAGWKPAARSRSAICSVTYTDRCFPPVQPNATVR